MKKDGLSILHPNVIIPALRLDLHAYAAVTGMIGVAPWAVTILPGMRKPDASSLMLHTA